jgi:hypothetical protein
MSWMDYQREYTEITKSLEQDIMEEEEGIYLEKWPKVGYLWKKCSKK